MAQQLYNYKHANSNSATGVVLSPNAGSRLHSVTINSKGATANLLTIYDTATDAGKAAGNTIAVIDTTTAVGTLIYDVVVNAGLTYVLNTGTAADVTIAWA